MHREEKSSREEQKGTVDRSIQSWGRRLSGEIRKAYGSPFSSASIERANGENHGEKEEELTLVPALVVLAVVVLAVGVVLALGEDVVGFSFAEVRRLMRALLRDVVGVNGGVIHGEGIGLGEEVVDLVLDDHVGLVSRLLADVLEVVVDLGGRVDRREAAKDYLALSQSGLHRVGGELDVSLFVLNGQRAVEEDIAGSVEGDCEVIEPWHELLGVVLLERLEEGAVFDESVGEVSCLLRPWLSDIVGVDRGVVLGLGIVLPNLLL
jgi:hypothetical protein